MCMIMVVSLTASLVVREINVNMMPLGLCALMMTLLLKPRLAMTVNTVMAILLGLIPAGTQNDLSSYMMINVIVSTFISGTLCVCIVALAHQPLGRNQRGRCVGRCVDDLDAGDRLYQQHRRYGRGQPRHMGAGGRRADGYTVSGIPAGT